MRSIVRAAGVAYNLRPTACVCQRWEKTPKSVPGQHHPVCRLVIEGLSVRAAGLTPAEAFERWGPPTPSGA